MKIAILILGGAALLTGCSTRREVVYETTPAQTTIIREPAASVRVYEPGVRIYRPYRQPAKLGEYHQNWYFRD